MRNSIPDGTEAVNFAGAWLRFSQCGLAGKNGLSRISIVGRALLPVTKPDDVQECPSCQVNHTLKRPGTWLQVIVFSAVVMAMWRTAVAADSPDFAKEVRPLLSDRCLACHGPDNKHREADLRLDEFSSMTRDRDGYAVVVPGHPEKSELIKRIMSGDPDLVMPPEHLGKKLTEQEKDVLRRWIASGAKVERHWAYVPPQSQPAPNVKDKGWPRNWIDLFILSRLEREGLQPSPDADNVTLVRRLYFDLTGLPPAPEDVNRFVGNPSDRAWEKLVDELLAGDEHAERMTAYWLDLVRFADTVGYHGDQDHNISPYRDWVIEAFADNMPFDQFTREQLAGDLIPDATIDQKTASGYNRLLQTSHEGGVQPKEYLAIYAADRVRNLSAVWMGATMGCAQCHDHKYDPYTMKDFYSLAAFFADLDEDQHFISGGNSLPTKRAPELRVHSRRERKRIAELKRQLTEVETALRRDSSDTRLTKRQETLQQTVEDLEESARLTMISVAKQPREMRILPRGNWLDDSGPIVVPAVPEFMGAVQSSAQRPSRLDLANWLCDPDHGAGMLTARVFANRFWYLLFGNGLSGSLDDFGGQGMPPEHPELLDQLALELVETRWNIRKILKLIVTSRTYRQSSQWTEKLRVADPDNVFFARQSGYRLSAEMVRDSALAVSGLLVQEVGGPSVKPYQPAGYYRHLNFPVRKYSHHADKRQWRRGLYVHWQRQFLHPMLKAFDAPSREECTAQRVRSNTPLAALTLLNDPTFVEAARSFAGTILKNTPGRSDADRINYAMRRAVSRDADKSEQATLLGLLKSSRSYFEQKPEAAKQNLSVGLLSGDPDLSVTELAAWSSVTRAILNLDEAITRN